MNPEIEQLKIKLEQLEQEIRLLKSASTIPFDFEMALRERLNIGAFNTVTGSSKGATSENQSVNEAGVASYSVLKAPDAFLQVTVASTVYYIPVFT